MAHTSATARRPRGGRALLAVALLAAGLAWLTEDPPTADAAEPGPEATCNRGKNPSFETPDLQNLEGSPRNYGVPVDSTSGFYWKTTNASGKVWLYRNYPRYSPQAHHGTQYARLDSGLYQEFPTLPGDQIAWSVQYHRRNYTAKVYFGRTATTKDNPTELKGGFPGWAQTAGVYTVTHNDKTFQSFTAQSTSSSASNGVDSVLLNLKCSVAITANVSFSGNGGVGDTATFEYVVENSAIASAAQKTGAASLTNVNVTDSLGSVIGCGQDSDEKVLKPAAADATDDTDHQMTCTTTYEVQQSDIDRGYVTSTATVTADDAVRAAGEADPKKPLDHQVKASASANSTTIPADPALAVSEEKTTVNTGVVAPPDRVDAGDTVTYSFVVTNDGNVTVDSVSLSLPGAKTAACPEPTLAPKATTTCVAVVELTQPQVDSGELSRAATVTATPRQGDGQRERVDAEVVTLTAAPAVGFDKAKTAPSAKVAAGGKVSYSFAVTNTGNVTLSGVSVADPKAGKVACPETSLAPGKKTTCTAVYTATLADIGAGVISNRATVTAKAPDKKTVTATDSESFDPGTGKTTAGRHAGPDRYATAVEISKATFAPGVEAVYVATGVNFPDALAGSAASGGDGPILLVTKDAIPSATLAELKRLKPKKIIVLGGTGVVSQSVESALRKEATTTRQSGSDRYSTAAAISAKHFDAGAAVAFVATGEDFPDALTGGPAAAKLGGPILLTQKAKLPSATVSELKRLKPKSIVVLGGTGVVSEAVEKALASYTAGEVSRLAGADRYSTGGAISKDAFKPGVPVAYVATGANFPDALAGGAAGAFKDGPVLLVAGGTIPKATAAELTRLKPRSIIVLGGMAVVPKTVETALGAYIR